MAQFIENIVIGYPIVSPVSLYSDGTIKDMNEENAKTYCTSERNIAKILKELGVVSSISEVRRNKPELNKDFTDLDCFWIKWGKRKFYVIVGLTAHEYTHIDWENI